MRGICGAVGLVAGLLSGAAIAQGQYAFTAGGEFSSGDYGTGETSEIWSFPIGLQYLGDRVYWSVSVPFLVVSAPTDFVVLRGGLGGLGGSDLAGEGIHDLTGDGLGPKSERGTTTRTVSGVGDVNVGVGLSLVEEGNRRPWMGAKAMVKIATADADKNLGTGVNDYALQLEAAKGWLSGRLGYRWMGDTPTIDFQNVAYGALAVTHIGGSGGDIGLELFGEQAIVAGSEERRELTLFGSYPLGGEVRIHGHAFKGLTDASADFGVGITLSFAL